MRFRMLGPLEIWDGTAWSAVRAARQRTLLAVLLVETGRVVSVDRLVEELWGERPPARAVETIQVYVGRLRRLLGGGPASPLVTRASGYELVVADGELDATVFERLAASARTDREAGSLDAALGSYTEALRLWRGPALADVPGSPLVAAEANRWELIRLGVLEDRLGVELELGRHAEIVDELHRLVGEHPFRERLQAHYLVALYRCGRRGEALGAYQDARRVLVDELGVEPGPELRGIEQAILTDDREPAAAAPPMRAAPTVRLVPAQLPPVAAGFTGRARQLEQLDALLDADADAVVISTVAGTAGVGKTALVVRWGHQVRERFVDGQLYVNLRGYAGGVPLKPIDALAGFLQALGVPVDQIPSDIDYAGAAFRSLLAGRRMLILLDNANHPDQVRPLLPGSPGSMVLVTSRDRMSGLVARDGAVRIDLDVLTSEESNRLLARLLGPARVAAEPAAANELADLCGHLPLALRIAAANLGADPDLPICDYTGRLVGGDRLAALQVHGDPQAGVRIAFDQSYRALPGDVRRLFCLLGLIPGPDFTASAAAALAGIPAGDAESLLGRLADAYLVDPYEPGRHRLHDLLRIYAAGQAAGDLDDGDRRAALSRLYAWYLRSVDAAGRALYPEMLRLSLPPALAGGPAVGFTHRTAALAWLDAERANLVAAVSHAAIHGPPAAAWRLADALRGHLMDRHAPEWSDVGLAGLAAAETDNDPRGMAAAHLSIAGRFWAAALPEPAIEHYDAALVLTRQSGWREGEAAILGNLGLVHWTAGALDDAAECFIAALAVDERTGQLASRAINLANLGLVYGAQGRLRLAASRQADALDCFRRVGSRRGEATSLIALGEIHRYLGRFQDAIDALTSAVTVLRGLGGQREEAEAIRILATVHSDLCHLSKARDLARTAAEMAREVGDSHNEAEALMVEAGVHDQRGEHRRAIAGFRDVLVLARRDGFRYTEAGALTGLAVASLHAGRPDEAVAPATGALALARHGGYRLRVCHALAVLAAIDLARGEPDRAVDHAEQALAIHADTGLRLGLARTNEVAADAYRAAGRPRESATYQA